MAVRQRLQALGLAQDRLEAYFWLNLSAAGGNGSAAKLRDELLEQLPREQIAVAQARARAFVPAKPVPPAPAR
jgi:TPR repeat protein